MTQRQHTAMKTTITKIRREAPPTEATMMITFWSIPASVGAVQTGERREKEREREREKAVLLCLDGEIGGSECFVHTTYQYMHADTVQVPCEYIHCIQYIILVVLMYALVCVCE